MSRLSRFQAKTKEVEIDVVDEDGNKVKEKVKITPFKAKDIDLLMAMSVPEKQTEATKLVLKKVLKENYPDFTEEEFNNMGYNFVNQFMEAILDVNGLGEESSVKSKFLEEIKAKQEASKK